MRITLSDDREYAWLLVRSETLVGELAKLWRLIPVLPGSAIVPATTEGRLLLALVSVFHASGVITMIVLVMASSFKPRELFKGTTRDLADYLENADTSSGTKMMIHRVGVVRPLDEQETVSLTKAEFVATISKPEGDVGDGTGDNEQWEERGRSIPGDELEFGDSCRGSGPVRVVRSVQMPRSHNERRDHMRALRGMTYMACPARLTRDCAA